MGQEFAQRNEWNENQGLDWYLTQYHEHSGVQKLVSDLNHFYQASPALHERDHSWDGFEWRVVDDRDQSVFAWLRRAHTSDQLVLVVANLTPNPRFNYEIRVPQAGVWLERINSDASLYGGSGMGNMGQAQTQMRLSPILRVAPIADTISLAPAKVLQHPLLRIEHVLSICLPPLSTMMFEWSGDVDHP